jgi:hypothetical protein
MQQRWNDTEGRKPEELGKKPVQVPLSPPQIPCGLSWARIRTSAALSVTKRLSYGTPAKVNAIIPATPLFLFLVHTHRSAYIAHVQF